VAQVHVKVGYEQSCAASVQAEPSIGSVFGQALAVAAPQRMKRELDRDQVPFWQTRAERHPTSISSPEEQPN
jgi:hypothetical protein